MNRKDRGLLLYRTDRDIIQALKAALIKITKLPDRLVIGSGLTWNFRSTGNLINRYWDNISK